MPKVSCLLSIASIFLIMSSVARAESVRSALTDFGLVGTWSTDCSKDFEQGRSRRSDNISVSFLGGRRALERIFFVFPKGDLLERDLKEEIDDAVRVTRRQDRIAD